MPYELRSTSPTGRFEVRVSVWEARNSLWVESPEIFDLTESKPQLRFGSELWSLDDSEWKSNSVVRLVLRKFPGNHAPVQLEVLADLQSQTASVQSSPPVPLEHLEHAMEHQLVWK
jgi:hypothetical protein